MCKLLKRKKIKSDSPPYVQRSHTLYIQQSLVPSNKLYLIFLGLLTFQTLVISIFIGAEFFNLGPYT